MKHDEIMEKKVWRNMGLTDEDFARIQSLLGRDPTYVEIGLFAAMWSEHCSYKHSKAELKKLPTKGEQVIQGPGENAGIVDIGDGMAIAFKMESHNHPTAVEPYHGAATGAGGIIRDCFTMGARPIALVNSVRFGDLSDAHNRYLFDGAISGIADYGNKMGVPTLAGEARFAPVYSTNPLVNAMCVASVRHEDIRRGVASGVGNAVMVIGAKTGRDGIHGAAFASEEFGEDSEVTPPTVQVGDPFMEKKLLEATLELFAKGIVIGMQDLGAAGLTSSSSEMASREGNGIELDMQKVPRRESGMTPYEIMLSETQERMLMVIEPQRIAEAEAVLRKWDLDGNVIGKVTDDGYLRIKDGTEIVAEVPARLLADEAPMVIADYREPAYIAELAAYDMLSLPEPEDYAEAFFTVLQSPNVASKEWIYSQFDQTAGGNTVITPGCDAGVVRIAGTDKAVAMATDCNGRKVYLNPYRGAKLAVAETALNIACSGAKPLGLTNCLNFGSPEKPEIFYTFKEALRGMSEAAIALNTPVTGGNVSLYNETDGKAIYPTPSIGMVGLLEKASNAIGSGFQTAGDAIFLVGEYGRMLGGTEYLAAVHGLIAGEIPDVNLRTAASLNEFLVKSASQQLIQSAHDISDGGLITALAEKAAQSQLGCKVEISLPGNRADRILFNEDPSRVLISVKEENVEEMQKLAASLTLPVYRLGTVGGEDFSLKVNNLRLKFPVREILEKWREAIPCIMSQSRIS